MGSNPVITIAVPTRDRHMYMRNFCQSLAESVRDYEDVRLLIVRDDDPAGDYLPNLNSDLEHMFPIWKVYDSKVKASLPQLWNWSIILSETDWTLVCNDDIHFHEGWLERLQEGIATGKYLQVNMHHYGAMAQHKRLMLRVGWHDERYRGGGFEDIDYQFRMREADAKKELLVVDDSRLISHHKARYPMNEGGYWEGYNNSAWIAEKWGRTNENWTDPSFRRVAEVDWHPYWTAKYEKAYGEKSTFVEFTRGQVNSGEPTWV